MVSLSDVRVAFEEGGHLMIGVVGNTKHTDGGGCINLESEGGREGVMCRVEEHQHRLAHYVNIFCTHTHVMCEVEHNGIWRWGIHGLNRWGIYGKMSCCFFGSSLSGHACCP